MPWRGGGAPLCPAAGLWWARGRGVAGLVPGAQGPWPGSCRVGKQDICRAASAALHYSSAGSLAPLRRHCHRIPFSAGSWCSCQGPARPRLTGSLGKGTRGSGMGQGDPAGEYEGPGMPDCGFLHSPCTLLGWKAQASLSLLGQLLSQQCVALWPAGSLRGGRWQHCLRGAPAPHGPGRGSALPVPPWSQCVPAQACRHRDRAGAGLCGAFDFQKSSCLLQHSPTALLWVPLWYLVWLQP